MEFKQYLVFKAPERDICFREEVSAAASRIYKDAVFDTNEYPGHRRAEAGNIKKSRAFAVPPVIPAEL